MLCGDRKMASAQFDGESYSVFVYDPGHTIDGSLFGILGRFIGMILFHPTQYLDHLSCDIPAYELCNGSTAFSSSDKLNPPDRITRLVWKCSMCGEFRFCHIWIKKEDYNEEEKKMKIAMIPVLKDLMSQEMQELQYETNLHFIVKAFVVYVFRFFVCHDPNPFDKQYLAGLSHDIPIILIR